MKRIISRFIGRSEDQFWSKYSLILLPGVPKCGTSSLFTDLIQFDNVIAHNHKEVNVPLNKEVMRDYWFHKVNPAGISDGTLIDASQNYCWDVENQDLEFLGKIPFKQIKVILMFRNPIFRAASNYAMNRKQHGWAMPFEKAWKNYVNEKGQVIMGNYWEFYSRNIKIFGKTNVMPLISEEYFSNRMRVLHSLKSFLGLGGDIEAFEHKIVSPMNSEPSSYQMNSELMNELKNHFAPFVQEFEEGLNFRTGWMD